MFKHTKRIKKTKTKIFAYQIVYSHLVVVVMLCFLDKLNRFSFFLLDQLS